MKKIEKLNELFVTSSPEYHGYHEVFTEGPSLFIEYFVVITGTAPSVSPLQMHVFRD